MGALFAIGTSAFALLVGALAFWGGGYSAPDGAGSGLQPPLTYAQDLMNHALLGVGLFSPWLDLAVLFVSGALYPLPSVKMHQRGRRLGY